MYRFKLDTRNADPLFLNMMFVKMFSKHQGGFQQFFTSKFKYYFGTSIK